MARAAKADLRHDESALTVRQCFEQLVKQHAAERLTPGPFVRVNWPRIPVIASVAKQTR
jgi:hypothetical protein